MRERKHPLEVYQRAGPFAGWEKEEERARKRRRPPRPEGTRRWRLPRPPSIGITRTVRRIRARLQARGGALGRVPLERVVRVAIPLVLIALVIYAARFWPAGGNGGSDDPSLQRNGWRDPLGATDGQDSSDHGGSPSDSVRGEEPLVYIQLASGPITDPSENPSLQAQHDADVRRWQEEAGRLQRKLEERAAASRLGDLKLTVEAWHTDMTIRNDIRLVIGGWEKGDPDVLSLLKWLKENGFEEARVWEPLR